MKKERELRPIARGGIFLTAAAGVPLAALADIVDPVSETLEWAAASIPFGTVVCFVLLSACMSAVLTVFLVRRERGDWQKHGENEADKTEVEQ